MPLREILQQWDAAVKAYKASQYTEALTMYRGIEELSARMYYNMSCVHIKLQQFSEAIECLSSAVKKDTQLAIAFFHRGLLHLKLDCLPEAKSDLHATLTLMRGNSVIDYKQLGLLRKLHQSEVLYSIALTEIKQGDLHTGEDTLHQALYDTELGQRRLIQEALNNIQNGTITAILPMNPSVENVFTPPKVITDNLEKRKYIPKAKVVSAANNTDVNPTFNGEKRVQEIRRFSEFSAAIKAPKSPLMAVRRIFHKGDKSLSHGMRLNKSMGDLRALAEDYDLSHGVRPQPMKEPRTAGCEVHDYGKATIPSCNHRPSMGSLFGNNLTAVSQVLSSSCDLLTALVLPAGQVTDASSENDDVSYNQNSTNTSIAAKRDVVNAIVAVTQEGAGNDAKLETDGSTKCDDGNDCQTGENGQSSSDVKVSESLRNCNTTETPEFDDQFSPVTVRSETRTFVEDGTFTSACDNMTKVKRQRPPPPSYPPPPLPSTVIVHI